MVVDFGGNTVINTNKHVRLTTDHASKFGYVWTKNARVAFTH
jgi:mannose-binding lectin 2